MPRRKDGQHWTTDQKKALVKSFRKSVEGGWEWLTPRVRGALVAEYVLGLVRTQERTEIPIAAIDELYVYMLKEIMPDGGPLATQLGRGGPR